MRTLTLVVLLIALLAACRPAEPVPDVVTPGAYCPDSQVGARARTGQNQPMMCTLNPGESRGRWRPV